MHSITRIEDLKAYSNCAQLYSIMQDFIHLESWNIYSKRKAKRIISKEGNVNFLIPSDCPVKDQYLQGGTILHIAWKSPNSELLEDLLNLGADFTIKNKYGHTALHCAFKTYLAKRNSSKSNECSKYLDHSHLKTMLSAHIKFANSSNPCDNNGLSHFQIACAVNSTEVVEFFLVNGADVNQVIDNGARQYPGFTPLHCAADCCSVETTEVLLKYGADRTIKNSYGMTPLDQLLNQKMELLGSKIKLTKGFKIEEALRNKVKAINEGIFLLLGNNCFDEIQIIDNTGLSSFHIACTMQDLCKVECLLEQIENINHCVKMESSMWPGYTALHFAAQFNDIGVMELLQRRGASIDVKNAKGLTPLDICLKIGHIEEIYASVLLKPEFANILFSDNKTRLVNFLAAMQDTKQLNNFLLDKVDDINMTLPSNFQLWPGCTPLHLAVILSTKYTGYSYYHDLIEKDSILEQIEVLLKGGADATRKDASGKTALHHAFQENKKEVTALLCKYHHSSVNTVDNDNLSHLHIACAIDDFSLIEKLLSINDIDVNIRYNGKKTVRNVQPGYTPLNCLLSNNSFVFGRDARNMLIERGAKVLSSDYQYGANTLHSACDKGDADAVRQLLALGADVNFASKNGLTSLHIATSKHFPRIAKLLLQKEADLLARDDEGHSPLSRTFEEYIRYEAKNVVICRQRVRQRVIAVLKNHGELQKRMEKETGITMLHIACYMLDVKEVKNQIYRGTKVNARVHEDSKIWSGCTALHVLMMCKNQEGSSEEKERGNDVIDVITQMLLENGTDVTLANTRMDTPIHVSYSDYGDNSRTKLFLKHHCDYRINPIGSEGLSHFHLAVILKCADVVQKFLEHGVNVNQPTNLFETFRHEHCIPLHMALCEIKQQSDVEVVKLLLNHGADVNLEDTNGQSAIHKAFYTGQFRFDLMESLLSLGADINSQDINGCTPLENILDWHEWNNVTAKDIQFFLQHGCRVNVNNPVTGEGFLRRGVLQFKKEYRDLLFEELIKAPDVTTVNEMGQTAIHNVVAMKYIHFFNEATYDGPEISIDEYVVLLEKLKICGLDVDHQDHAGQTALHVAEKFDNDIAIQALLRLGADLNIVNSKGYFAFSYDICKHILKLKYFGLTLNICDDNFPMSELSESYVSYDGLHRDYETAKNCTIGELPLNLGDFLSESKGVVKYSRMSESSRDVIDKYFESNCMQFEEILPILKLQHRKARKRFRLVEAISTMKDLVGFSLPLVCVDKILRFLSIADLKNVVEAINFEV